MLTPDRTEETPRRDELSRLGHIRATLALGLPLVGAQLAQMAINVTDTVMVGQLGATELAAAVLGTQTFFIVFIFGTGFAQAVMPVAASAEGQGDVRGVRRSVRMGLWVLALYSILMMWPLWHTEAILLHLGQEAEPSALAGDYVRVVQWSMLPALTVMGLRSFLSVVGRAHVVFFVFLGGVLLNAALNYAFIFGHFGAPALGLIGAAIASLCANVLMAASLLGYALSTPELRRYELAVRLWRPDWEAFFEVLRLGWPIGLTIIAEVGLFAASSIMMGWLGIVPLAAHGIVLQLASIAFMIPLGLASAATVRVGTAYGRRNLQDLARAGITALGVAAAVAVGAAVLFWTMPEVLIGLYLDSGNPNSGAILHYGIPLLAVAAAFQIVDALQVVGSGILRGMKDTRTPMLIALFSYWIIGMPTAYLLAFHGGWDGIGIWWGLAFGLLAAAILMNRRFLRRTTNGLLPADPAAVASR